MTPGKFRLALPDRSATLNTKLVVSFLVLGVVPALALGWYAYQSASNIMRETVGRWMEEAAVTDGEMIDRNLFERYGDVQAFAANPDAVGTPSEQQAIVDLLMESYAIYDLMLLVDVDGEVMAVNSVDSTGATLDSGGLVGRDVSDTDWFQAVAEGNTPSGGTYYGEAHYNDLVADAYGAEVLTLPFTAPIYDDAGEVVALWHNEASFERAVWDLVKDRQHVLAGGEDATVYTQILSREGQILTHSESGDNHNRNLLDDGLEATVGATWGPGSSGFTNGPSPEDGEDHLFGYAVTDGALGFEGYEWGVIVHQSAREAAAPAYSLRGSLFLIGLLIVTGTAASGFWLARSLSRPLRRNVAGLEQVSKGDLRVEFDVHSRDEVGQMASALNTALDSIGTTMAQVDHSASDLTTSANHLTSLSREMSGAANHTSDQANEVAAVAGQMASSSNSVARAMDQMSASVREISDNTADAARMTAKAVEVSGLTRHRMEKLDASATDIGNVVSVITSIAEQTDLLALNATIEAARVGEAGKGFAVVANEVKALASQTSKATEEIQAKIEAIQSDAVGAVEAIVEISELIDKVNETSTTIAGAVEEQSATTAEVSSSIQAVTNGTSNISANITAVADAARTTTAGAGKALEAAGRLSVLADHLNGVLARFTLSDEQQEAAASMKSTDSYRVEPPSSPTSLVSSAAPPPPVATPGRPDQRKVLEDLSSDLVSAGWR